MTAAIAAYQLLRIKPPPLWAREALCHDEIPDGRSRFVYCGWCGASVGFVVDDRLVSSVRAVL